MSIIETFQQFVAQVPELLQPVAVALIGAVPFVEGEGATAIGVIGGLHPVVAAVAAALGNFACVAVLVLLGSGARSLVVNRRSTHARERDVAGSGSGSTIRTIVERTDDGRTSQRKQKFQRALVRYGVPGVSLLGPLLLPTQFTATFLAAAGVARARILFWQALAIALWTTITAVIIWTTISALR